MNFKKLYFQKEQAQLDRWKSDLIELNSKALLASADIRLEMNKHIRSIGNMLNECEKMLINDNTNKSKAINSINLGVESALSTLKHSVIDATVKFK